VKGRRIIEEGKGIPHGPIHVLGREDLHVSPGERDCVGPEVPY
jgi:hypothetical protein